MNYATADYSTEHSLTLHEVTIHGQTFKAMDYSLSLTPFFVFRELMADHYKLVGRKLPQGGVILDIGANVGIVSIYMAKLFPGHTIYAYEPLPINYANLLKNLRLNDVVNVVPVNAAVTADGRELVMHFNLDNTGGASAITGLPPYNEAKATSVTLQGVFDAHGIDRVALMKMDVEGAEHEILAGAGSLLDRIGFLAMEAHFSAGLRAKGHTPQTLQRSLQPLIARKAVAVTAQEVPG